MKKLSSGFSPTAFNQPWFQHSLILVVMLMAAWLHLWRLPQVPPGFWYDEAYEAMDGIWILDTHKPQVFFVGNNGREPMLSYLGTLSMSFLGATPYTFRLVSALLTILAIPLMYRWLITFFAGNPERHRLGLIAATGLNFSLWYLVMSRTGYRASLFPLFVILTAYLFWQGWRSQSLHHFAGAGVALGFSQYTYLSARLLPLVLGLFVLAWLLQHPSFIIRRSFWAGLLVMMIVSLIIFLPLGLFFLDNPTALSSRTDQVFVLEQITRGEISLTKHLFDALRVFVDGSDPNWRHNLVGRPGFDWLNTVGFWVGLLVAARRFRQPGYLFLLVSLGIMWLPALLSTPAIHTLRLSGLLPIYYALMAVGLLSLARLLSERLPWQSAILWMRPVLFALVLVISGGLTTYDYFVRWANEPMVYKQYEGPLVDLTRYLMAEADTADVLLPFQMYIHPTTRLLLHDKFREIDTSPLPDSNRPTLFVSLPDFSLVTEATKLKTSSAYVWLTHDASKNGVAFVSRPTNGDSLIQAGQTIPFLHPYTGETVALLTSLKGVKPTLPLFAQQSHHGMDYRWDQVGSLIGYEVLPDPVLSGQVLVLNLYWQGLGEESLNYKTLIQLVNGQGSPTGEWEQDAFLDQMLHWRQRGITLTEHKLWINPETASGPYLLRLGLLDPKTNQQLLYTAGGKPVSDQLLPGLLYITESGGADPRLPPNQLQMRLGDQIELLGYSSPGVVMNEALFLKTQLYWRASNQVSEDYVAFVQLLDIQDQPVAGWASQPLAGQYPTSRWQSGEVVVDEFDLPLPVGLTPGDYRLVAGMYNPITGLRLPAFDVNGQRLPEDLVTLIRSTVP